MPKVDENANVFIKAVANIFTTELSCYKSRLDLSNYKSVSLDLRVTLGEKPEFELTFSPAWNESIKHTDLSKLMAEAYRRADWHDQADASIQRESDALLALPAPEEV